jgi:hypothetical protein
MTLLRSSRRRLAVSVAALLVASAAAVLPAPVAATTPAASSAAAAAWLARLVGPDGAVDNPYAPGVPSVSWTVNVALALATTGSEPAALASAMGWIEANVDDYVAEAGPDNPGRLGYLIMLAVATERDPRSFGAPATDLVARTTATYGSSEPGLFGAPDTYSSVTLHSLAVLGLVAAGEPVPAEALAWLADQQCRAGEGPTTTLGGWQGYRAPDGSGLADCVVDAGTFVSPDSNNTSFALQALAATGSLGLLQADAGAFLGELQATSGPRAGGFAFDLLSAGADPNSTAVVLQALATGRPLATWAAGGQDPLVSLETWVILDGLDAGALASPFSDGFGDVFATYQGVWGLALAPFPFPVAPVPQPPAPTTPSTVAGPEPGPGVPPVAPSPVVAPRFTG